MAVNTVTVVAVKLLCLALLACLIMNANANVIKRREIATKQQLQRNGPADDDMHTSDNRTATMGTTMLTLHAPDNDGVTQKSTKLLLQRADTVSTIREAENPFITTTPKKIILKKLNDATESIEGDTKYKPNPSEMSTTTSAMPNTIENVQERKELQTKNVELAVSTTLKHSTTETTLLPITKKPVELTPTTTVTNVVEKIEINATPETLLHHKAQLSLEDTNEIQISSSSKQAKFLNDNSTISNQLNLPNTADVWTLAGMKTVSPRSNQSYAHEQLNQAYLDTSNNKSSLLQPIKEKTLTDWTQIVQMGVEKSVGNSLTEEQQQNLLDEEVTSSVMLTTTVHAMTPGTTLSELQPTSMKPTTPTVNVEKIVSPNETTTITPPVTSVNSTQSELLSAIDNVEANVTKNLAGAHTEFNIKNKEKYVSSEEHEESKSSTVSISQRERTETAVTTTMKMTTISTPATAIVSTTVSTAPTSEGDVNGLHDDESEKGNKAAVIDEIKTTASSAQLGNQVEITTSSSNIPNVVTSTVTTTTTTTPTSILATNVEEVINFATTTRQPSPDIHQIGIKSNLETPTTTIATIDEATIETTPTISAQRVNSSAITNETLTQAKENGDNDDDDVTNNATTSDSLSAQSTSSVELIFSTIQTPTTSVTTENTTETYVSKDTSSTTSTSTVATFEYKQQEQENHINETTTAVFERPIITTTTVNPPLTTTETHTEEVKSTTLVPVTSTITTTRNNTEMSNETVPAVGESTSTETPLVNFIDDSTTTTTTSTTTTTTTPTTTTAVPDSTISLITISTSSSTSTTSTPVLSVQTTNADELHSTPNNETTTPLITEETPTTTTSTTTIPTSTASIETTTPSSSTSSTELPAFIPPQTTVKPFEMVPILNENTTNLDTAPSTPSETTINPLGFSDNMGVLHAQPPKSTPDSPETDVNVVIAISVSVIGVVALILLVAFLYLMRKRQKATSYGQRCRPVSLDAYSLDNVSVLGSVRRKGALRASKRSYGNAAFDDPSLRHNVIQTSADLAKFVERRSSIFEEFRDVPQIIARPEEIPEGCENKNRYANVIPLPETRVILQRRNDDDTTEYINANYVRGPKDAPNYYIACQAPLDSTVQDFWRMIWEQQSRVIIQATDLIENGAEKCAEYLPPSVTLDNHTTFGDFQVTLKNREVKDKYAISTIMLKDTISNNSREITHYWYKWPEIGVPTEEAPIIAMLLEARSSLKSYALEVTNELKSKSTLNLNAEHENGDTKESLSSANGAGPSSREINGNVSEKTKNIARNQGPLTIHCSPGTGRTGTIIACDIAIRSLETTKSLDIPQIVYYIRRGRASAVQTKEQYEFIYKVANVYAMKITNVPNDN